jgi:hypothetical protein
MLLAYFPIILFENFARMTIAVMQMGSLSSAAAKPNSDEPTIILLE